MSSRFRARRALRLWLFSGAVALATFLWVGYGRTLATGDLTWIWADDPFAHVMGWEQYRNAPLAQYPLGRNEGYGLERSSSIVYSDSIPAAAIALRPLSPLLPRPFNYLGWWVLLSMILQGYWGARLVMLRSDRMRDAAIGCAFFVTAPVLLNRIGVHSALASHWMLLCGFWIYFSGGGPRHRAWAALLLLATGIHAYLFVMVGAIWAAHMASCALRGSWSRRDGLWAAGIVVLVLAWMHALGYFAVTSDAVPGGTPSRFDLTAFVNGQRFTMLLPRMPGIDWDSNAYLGAGLLALLIASAIAFAVRRWGSARPAPPPAAPPPIRVRWEPLLIAVGALALFAITHRLMIAGSQRAHVPQPPLLASLYATFRGSARMIWPAYYLIMLSILWFAIRVWRPRAASIVMAAALVVQLVDIRDGVALKAAELRRGGLLEPLRDPVWATVASRYRRLVSVPAFHGQPHRHTLAWFCARHGLGSNVGYFGRMDRLRYVAARSHAEAVLSGRYEPGTAYYVPSVRVWSLARLAIGARDLAVIADGLPLILPGAAAAPMAIGGEPPPGPVLDAWMPMTADAPGRELLLGGWWPWGEGWGTWSEGPEALLLVPVPAGERVRLTFRWLASSPAGRPQSVRISADEQRRDVHFAVNGVYQDDHVELTAARPWVLVRLEIAAPHSAFGGTGVGLQAVRVELLRSAP